MIYGALGGVGRATVVNAELLHALALDIRKDLDEGDVRRALRDLAQQIASQVANPQEASHQQNISSILTSLRSKLPSAQSNSFVPAWRAYLDELGISGLLGNALLDRIDSIFSRNGITPSVAQLEIEALLAQVEQLHVVVDSLINDFVFLRIPPLTLAPGEYEVSVTIPRSFVDNEVGKLGDEFEEIRKVFLPIAELATGSRPPFEIRSISSSNFILLLNAMPAVASAIAIATAAVVAAYKELAGIRQVQEMQRTMNLPSEILAQTEEFATQQMKDAIDVIADRLLNEGQGNLAGVGRRFEVEAELKRSLRTIAFQYDHGVQIRVRAEPPALPAGAEDAEVVVEPTDEMRTYLATMEAAKELDYANTTGVPILSLPVEASPDATGPDVEIPTNEVD